MYSSAYLSAIFPVVFPRIASASASTVVSTVNAALFSAIVIKFYFHIVDVISPRVRSLIFKVLKLMGPGMGTSLALAFGI